MASHARPQCRVRATCDWQPFFVCSYCVPQRCRQRPLINLAPMLGTISSVQKAVIRAARHRKVSRKTKQASVFDTPPKAAKPVLHRRQVAADCARPAPAADESASDRGLTRDGPLGRNIEDQGGTKRVVGRRRRRHTKKPPWGLCYDRDRKRLGHHPLRRQDRRADVDEPEAHQ